MYLYDHVIICSAPLLCVFFFFNDTATTEIYTLPLHDALPIFSPHLRRYIVQNDVMRNDLVRYHGIDNDRIVVTGWPQTDVRSEEHTSELQSRLHLVCRLLLETKKSTYNETDYWNMCRAQLSTY